MYKTVKNEKIFQRYKLLKKTQSRKKKYSIPNLNQTSLNKTLGLRKIHL